MTGMGVGLPRRVGYGVEGVAAVPVTSSDYEVLINGIGFMRSIDPNNPMIRRGAEYRTPQMNFSAETGQRALGFWWQRSQSSYHGGAGNPTFDGPGSGDPNVALTRFSDSYGVNPWEPGQLTLLKDVDLGAAITGVGCGPVSMLSAGLSAAVYTDLANVKTLSQTGVVTTTAGAWGVVKSLCSNGTQWFLTDGTKIYSNGTTVIPYQGLTATVHCLRWAKQRLMYGADNKVYQLEVSPPGAPAALPTAVFTHPNPSWVWTDFVEGPGAIYGAGYAGTTSAVYKFVLDTSGDVPTLTTGITACELPAGERVLSMCSYISSFIALGTSQGVRVCEFNGTDIALAPLSITDASVKGIAGWDRFLYATADDAGSGCAGLYRIDLSRLTEFSRYAWARDLRANSDPAGFTAVTGTVGGVAIIEGRGVFRVEQVGVYQESLTRPVMSGSLTTGRITAATSDLKTWQRVSLDCGGNGLVTLFADVDQTPSTQRLVLDPDSVNLSETDLGALRGVTLALSLRLDRASTTEGPEFHTWLVKCLPAQAREEQIIIPLRCYDQVEGKNGVTLFASARSILRDIADLSRSQSPVVLQTFFGDPALDFESWVVQVEDFEFHQTVGEPSAGWGGILTISCRTVAGS